MRYVINTEDTEGLIGIQLSKWQKENKLTIIEKSDTLINIEERLERVSSALSILKKVGYSSEIMKIYLKEKTKMSMTAVSDILYHQEVFLKHIGALK